MRSTAMYDADAVERFMLAHEGDHSVQQVRAGTAQQHDIRWLYTRAAAYMDMTEANYEITQHIAQYSAYSNNADAPTIVRILYWRESLYTIEAVDELGEAHLCLFPDACMRVAL